MRFRVDPKELDALLYEVVLLSTRTELYFRFLQRRAVADLDVASENADEYKSELSTRGFSTEDISLSFVFHFYTPVSLSGQQKKVEHFLNNCYLTRIMQEIIGNYIILEEYFMREMIGKAISMDTLEEESKTSSMVDDVFFIIKKCIK